MESAPLVILVVLYVGSCLCSFRLGRRDGAEAGRRGFYRGFDEAIRQVEAAGVCVRVIREGESQSARPAGKPN